MKRVKDETKNEKRKICKSVSDTGLIPRIYKELSTIIKRLKNPIKKWEKMGTDILQRRYTNGQKRSSMLLDTGEMQIKTTR